MYKILYKYVSKTLFTPLRFNIVRKKAKYVNFCRMLINSGLKLVNV